MFNKFCVLFLLIPCLLCGTELIPVDIREAANRSFRDDFPDDGKGGWIDQGSCDMRKFPAGKFVSDTVNFQILSDKATGNKSCIVIGNMESKDFRNKAVLPVKTDKSYSTLYLLHSGMWLKKSAEPAGVRRGGNIFGKRCAA